MCSIKYYCYLLLLLPSFIQGQSIEKVISRPTNEVYYVLKSDHTTKQGPYQKMVNKYDVEVNGYYKNGLKDSLWTYYSGSGRQALTQGMYAKDHRIGIWENYDYHGNLIQKYDYKTKSLIFNTFNDVEKNRAYRVIVEKDSIEKKLDRIPVYIGNENLIAINHMNYPAAAKEKGVKGTVYISFIIDKEGKSCCHKVAISIDPECDAEALKAIKSIPDNWLPGILDGKPVDVEFGMTVDFIQ